MPRKAKFPPSILHHKPSNRDRIRVDGQDIWLGPHDSAEARARYAAVVAELSLNGGHLPIEAGAATIRTLIARWLEHAEVRYAGKDELNQFRHALAPLVRLYGELPVVDFGPKCLKAYQRATATGSWLTPQEKAERRKIGRPATRCRRVVNRHTVRVKTVFRWLESEQLIPPSTLHALETVAGLAEGEAEAIDYDEVPPVPEADLAATIPVLNPIVRAAVQLQVLTGARPGEVLGLRPADLNRSGSIQVARGITIPLGKDVWAVVKVKGHKMAHRRQRRIILIGPQGQRILEPLLLGRDQDAYIFSPREATEGFLRETGRKIRHARERRPGERYTTSSYGRAIDAGCRRAKVQPWDAHQLRHNAATRLTEEFGWEVARILLGHKSVETTKLYALDAYQKAAEAVRDAG